VEGGIAAQAAAAAGDESNLALHVRSSLVDGASPSTLLARQFIDASVPNKFLFSHYTVVCL